MSSQFSIIKAVENLNYRVTVGDVATQSGLDLNLVQGELLNLATKTSGNLQVSETGEIVYVFSPELRQILRNRDFKVQVQIWLSGLWKWLFFLIRISFGILLVVSIAIVVIGIGFALVALQSRNSSDDNGDRSDNSNNSDGGGFGFIPYFFDFGNVFAPAPQRQSLESDQPKMGFLESIFSFLFGDGNPNFDLEERRNRAIAGVIRRNDGVVVAEQVAPYLDKVTDTIANFEDYMIPVLAKFNGLPQVTDIGTLAYSFPDLQKVAVAQTSAQTSAKTSGEVGDGYLEENLWQFSKAGIGKISLAIALGVFYLGAALVLGNLLGQLGGVSGSLGLLAIAYPFLLTYAILFLTIPTIRLIVLGNLNKIIKERNLLRGNRGEFVLNPAPALKQKLELARKFAIAEEVISADNLAYTTESDLNDQEYAKMFKQNLEP